jgi:hypothetical protein
MYAEKQEQISPRLLENIKSAVELFATFGTEDSTVGSQIKVSCRMNYESGHLTVRFKYGELWVEHAVLFSTLNTHTINEYLSSLYGLTQAFVLDIIEIGDEV